MSYLYFRMREPTLDDLKQIGASILGQDLDGKPSKKEEKMSMELALKHNDIDNLQRQVLYWMETKSQESLQIKLVKY